MSVCPGRQEDDAPYALKVAVANSVVGILVLGQNGSS